MFEIFSNAHGYQVAAALSALVAIVALVRSYLRERPRPHLEINSVSPLRKEANSHWNSYFGGRDFDVVVKNQFDHRIWIDQFDGRAHPWFLIGATATDRLALNYPIGKFLEVGETQIFRVWIAGKEAPLSSFVLILHWSPLGSAGRRIQSSYKATAAE